MSSVSNGLYFLTLPLVSVMRVIYRKIRHERYLYIKRNVENVWGARYILGARYLSKNTVYIYIYRSQDVQHLDSTASYLPTGLHLGFFRSWPSLYLPSSLSSVFLVLSFVSASTSILKTLILYNTIYKYYN